MLKGPLRFLALLALALGAIFAVPAVASAHTPSSSHLGFCKNSEVGHTKVVDGKTYRCTHDGKVNEWELISTPTPSASVSHTAAPSPSMTASNGAVVPTPTVGGSGAAGLPVTGAKEDVMAAVGAGAVALGGVGLWFGLRRRRNRVQFQA